MEIKNIETQAITEWMTTLFVDDDDGIYRRLHQCVQGSMGLHWRGLTHGNSIR